VSAAADDSEYLTVAHIVRPRGNKGEVAADAPGNDESNYQSGQTVWLIDARNERTEFKVEQVWPHKGRLILKFEGIDSISAAEELRGRRVQIRRDQLRPLEDGEYYFNELIGCRVTEDGTGRALGVVNDVLEPGGTMLLEVRNDDSENEILIPLHREICVAIDPDEKLIRVRMPEGLEDLNR
jgi:16S rRNA processing protein RimM